MDFWASIYREFEMCRCNARLNTYTNFHKNHNEKNPAHESFAIHAQGI